MDVQAGQACAIFYPSQAASRKPWSAGIHWKRRTLGTAAARVPIQQPAIKAREPETLREGGRPSREKEKVVGRRTTSRKPLLLLRLFGLLLLRYAARALSRLLIHDPPRKSPGCPRQT